MYAQQFPLPCIVTLTVASDSYWASHSLIGIGRSFEHGKHSFVWPLIVDALRCIAAGLV